MLSTSGMIMILLNQAFCNLNAFDWDIHPLYADPYLNKSWILKLREAHYHWNDHSSSEWLNFFHCEKFLRSHFHHCLVFCSWQQRRLPARLSILLNRPLSIRKKRVLLNRLIMTHFLWCSEWERKKDREWECQLGLTDISFDLWKRF